MLFKFELDGIVKEKCGRYGLSKEEITKQFFFNGVEIKIKQVKHFYPENIKENFTLWYLLIFAGEYNIIDSAQVILEKEEIFKIIAHLEKYGCAMPISSRV